jgi:hypothetical protein
MTEEDNIIQRIQRIPVLVHERFPGIYIFYKQEYGKYVVCVQFLEYGVMPSG